MNGKEKELTCTVSPKRKSTTKRISKDLRCVKELRNLRVEKELPAIKLVESVQTLYPRYDKMLQSKCEHGDEYGIRLMGDAMTLLTDLYRPAKAAAGTRGDRHRYTCSVRCRLPDAQYRRLQQVVAINGFGTMQDALTSILRDYINKEESKLIDLPDAPYIREAERYGLPDEKPAVCPVCGKECDTIYTYEGSEVVGCDQCLTAKDASDVPECFPQQNEEDSPND